MRAERLGIGIVGCGNIAGPYSRDLRTAPAIELVGVTDAVRDRADALASEMDRIAYPSLDELLADDLIDIVVNLTTHHAHHSVTKASLEAGKHVYSEKPLALMPAQACELVELARARGLRLACAPSSFLGEGQQTAWQWVREGRLGTVRVAYAEVNWGRIESWHPSPEAFYDVGVVPDVAVYPLTLLTVMFGPARRVLAYGRLLYPDRKTMDGTPFRIATPEFVVAMIELEHGPIVRLTANWYVEQRNSKGEGIELHGDDGSLTLSSWLKADAALHHAAVRGELLPIPPVREAATSIPWTRGLQDLAAAITEGRRQRVTGEQAAHVVDIVDAIQRSMTDERPVEIHSSFAQPEPMDWAR